MKLKETITELNERMAKLEGKFSNENTIDFPHKMDEIKNRKELEEKDKKEKEMTSIVTIYKEGIANNKLEIVYHNLPKIVEFSVQFVEEFFLVAAKILNIVLSNKKDKSEFKLDMCLNLMRELFTFSLEDMPLISSMIDEVVKLLFNREKYEEVKDKEIVKRKKKNGSIRKIKKILNPF